MFDKLKCIDNIYALAKIRGINVGELEQTAEVSRGYLSRLAKEGTTTNPSIELLVSIAGQLNVSLDTLINGDFVHLSNKEQYIYDFIHKLKILTDKGKIEWERTKVYEQESSYSDEDYYTCDPAYFADWFKSDFVDRYSIKDNAVYFGNLPNSDKRILIMEIAFEREIWCESQNEETVHAIEVYITKSVNRHEAKINAICSSAFVVEELKKEIEELNSYVYGARSRIGLNDDAKNTIDNFMSTIDEEGRVKDNLVFLEDNSNNDAADDEILFT